MTRGPVCEVSLSLITAGGALAAFILLTVAPALPYLLP